MNSRGQEVAFSLPNSTDILSNLNHLKNGETIDLKDGLLTLDESRGHEHLQSLKIYAKDYVSLPV